MKFSLCIEIIYTISNPVINSYNIDIGGLIISVIMKLLIMFRKLRTLNLDSCIVLQFKWKFDSQLLLFVLRTDFLLIRVWKALTIEPTKLYCAFRLKINLIAYIGLPIEDTSMKFC